jgi:homoserine acetyltransferase
MTEWGIGALGFPVPLGPEADELRGKLGLLLTHGRDLMDDDVKQAFERVDARFDTMGARLDTMMERINAKMDDLLTGMEAMRREADVTRGHLAFVLEDSVTLGRRLTRLEEEVRRQRP